MTNLILVMILAILIVNLLLLVRVAYLLSDARDSLGRIRNSLSRSEVRLELQKEL